MFYRADLDARLRDATFGRWSVDDLVRDVVRRRLAGERFGVEEWCALVRDAAADDETQVLEAMVFTGAGRPGAATFAVAEGRLFAPDRSLTCDRSVTYF